jgi:hypothetical protein
LRRFRPLGVLAGDLLHLGLGQVLQHDLERGARHLAHQVFVRVAALGDAVLQRFLHELRLGGGLRLDQVRPGCIGEADHEVHVVADQRHVVGRRVDLQALELHHVLLDRHGRVALDGDPVLVLRVHDVLHILLGEVAALAHDPPRRRLLAHVGIVGARRVVLVLQALEQLDVADRPPASLDHVEAEHVERIPALRRVRRRVGLAHPAIHALHHRADDAVFLVPHLERADEHLARRRLVRAAGGR